MVRIAVPTLPEDAVFVTYVLERGAAKVNGTMRDKYDEIAVFTIQSQDPADAQLSMMLDAKVPYAVWKVWERAYENIPNRSDPGIFVFTEVAKDFTERYSARKLQALLAGGQLKTPAFMRAS